MNLSDVLSTDVNYSRSLAGSRFFDYEQHVDYKLRSGNFIRAGSALETVESLRNKYSGYSTAMEPSGTRVDLLKEVRDIFAQDGQVPNVSQWGDAEYNGIHRSLGEYESKIMQNDMTQSEQAQVSACFDQMRDALAEDGFCFVVDCLTTIDTQLALASGNLGALEQANTVGSIIHESENKVELAMTQEVQNHKLSQIEKRNKRALEVYNNEDEHYVQVLSAEPLSNSSNHLLHSALKVAGLGYVYMVATGTGTISAIVGFPLAAYWIHNNLGRDINNDSVEYIKDVYLRKEDGKLDMYLYKGGAYTKCLEAVNAQDVNVQIGENANVKSAESIPMLVKLLSQNSSNLASMKSSKLPAGLMAVTVNGKSYFMNSNFYLNQNHSSLLNL